MATYYKYVERNADSYVNWADIGNNLVETFRKTQEDIAAKKDAFDKASNEATNVLSAPPQGESKSASEYGLEYSANAQKAMLNLNNMLKRGDIDYSQWSIMKQNLLDGSKQAFGVIKNYQDIFKSKWERMASGVSSTFEQNLMKQAEEFGDFTKTQLYINPTDYRVSVAQKEKQVIDGHEVYAMSKDPNKFTSVDALAARLNGNFNKYDLNTNMKTYVDGLGANLKTVELIANGVGKTGLVADVLDPTKRTNLSKDEQGVVETFEAAETKMLQSQLSNEYNAASILTDHKNMASNGAVYRFTWDENDAAQNPEAILIKNTGSGLPTPVLSEEQRKDALGYLRTQARMRYDYKETSRTTPALPDIANERRQTDILQQNANTSKYNADTARMELDIKRLQAQNQALALKIKADKENRKKEDKVDNTKRQAFDNWVTGNISIVEDSGSKTAAGIQTALNKLGIKDVTVTGDDNLVYQTISIKTPGMPKAIEFPVDDPEDLQEIQEIIKKTYPLDRLEKIKFNNTQPTAKPAKAGEADEMPAE